MTGYAFATALAAPVDDGMMLAEAARPARQAVAAWTVVINPLTMPNFVNHFDERCKAVG